MKRTIGLFLAALTLTACANLKFHVSASYMNDNMAAELEQAKQAPRE